MDCLLFFGTTYYPTGGWGDFQGRFPSVDEAKAAAAQADDGCEPMWVEIVQEDTVTHWANRGTCGPLVWGQGA